MRRVSIPVWLIVMIVAALFTLFGAAAAISYSGPSPSDARKTAVEDRADTFNRAKSMIPDPGKQMRNFPIRRALVEMTLREDKINHPWYVYITGDNGNTIGYYVAKWPPINSCDFLSSTEDIYNSDNGVVKMQSPSYDGVYYGQASCDTLVLFDSITNAEIKVDKFHTYVSDVPLKLDAARIKVTK